MFTRSVVCPERACGSVDFLWQAALFLTTFCILTNGFAMHLQIGNCEQKPPYCRFCIHSSRQTDVRLPFVLLITTSSLKLERIANFTRTEPWMHFTEGVHIQLSCLEILFRVFSPGLSYMLLVRVHWRAAVLDLEQLLSRDNTANA